MWMLLGCLTLPSEHAHLWTAAADLDQDGHGAERYGGGDCDDDNPAVFPGASEVPYNGVDDDCDPRTLDDDLDQDGVPGDVDCDDEDETVGAASMLYVDLDADGYGTTELGVDCPSGAVAVLGDDCDDGDPAINPGEIEVCENGIDDNCSGADDCRLLGEVGFSEYAWVTGSGSQDLALHTADGMVVATGLEDGPAQYWVSDSSSPAGSFAVVGGYSPSAIAVRESSSGVLVAAGMDQGVALVADPTGSLSEFPEYDAHVVGLKAVQYLAIGTMSAEDPWIAVHTGSSVEILGAEDGPLRGDNRADQVTMGSVRLRVGPIHLADIDGDGRGELIARPGRDDAAQVVGFTFPMSPGSTVNNADWSIDGAPGDEEFGKSTLIQDLDDDGYNDLIIGSPTTDTFSADGGVIQVFPGPITDTVPDPTAQIHTNAGANLGDTLSFCGDVDWDDHADLLAGMPGVNDGDGGAVLLYGPFEGTMHVDDLPNLQILGDSGQGVGPVACPGDLDGDEIPDLVIGATNLLSGQSPELALISGQAQ